MITDLKTIVQQAKSTVLELFTDEGISNVGLEELEVSDDGTVYQVTIGFSRPWDYAKSPIAQIQGGIPKREYKVIKLTSDGTMMSINNREQ